MRLLLDTHLLLWIAEESDRLPREVRELLREPEHEFWFSVVNLWEIAIKRGLRRRDFMIDPRELRMELLLDGYQELLVTSEHALAVEGLAQMHRDPFDRMLVAQATVEGIMLLTTDDKVGQYGGVVRRV